MRTQAILLIGTILLVGCGDVSVQTRELPADAFQTEADVAVAMGFANFGKVTDESPEKPDRQVGDTCDNCNGTGKSGDGLGRCRVCGGDGRIDERDLRSTTTAPIIPPTAQSPDIKMELHVSKATVKGWPQKFWQQESDYFRQLGIDVSYIDDPVAEPYLSICGNGKCAKVSGPMNREQLIATIRQVSQ